MSNLDLLTAAKVALDVMRECIDSGGWDVVEAIDNLAEAIKDEEARLYSLSSWGADIRTEHEEHSREEEGGRE